MNNDLISREALKKVLTSDTRNIYVFECLSRVLEKIDNVPTVEERPHGKWIEFDDGSVACSVCGTGTSIKSIPSVVFFRYCPNCGAKMGGGADDEHL